MTEVEQQIRDSAKRRKFHKKGGLEQKKEQEKQAKNGPF